MTKKNPLPSLAGVARLVEHLPMNQEVTIDFRAGHMPGLWVQSPVRGEQETAYQCFSHMNVSVSLPLPETNKNIFKKIICQVYAVPLSSL